MNTQDAKRLFTLLADHHDPSQPLENELTRLFVPAISFNSDKLTLKSSLHGRISTFLNVKDNQLVRREKIRKVFEKALSELQITNSFFQQFSLDFRNKVFTLFSPQPEPSGMEIHFPPLKAENTLALRIDAIREESSKTRETYFKKHSYLHGSRDKSEFTLDNSFIQSILKSSYKSGEETFKYLIEFFRQRKTLKKNHLELIRKVEEGKKLFETLKRNYLKQKETLPSVDEAKEWAEKIAGLNENESIFFCTHFGGTPFQNLYKLFNKLPQGFKPDFKIPENSNLPDPKTFVQEKIHESFEAFASECPELPKELKPMVDVLLSDPKRSLPDGVKKWLPRFVGTPIEKLMQTGLLKTLLFFLPEGKIAELLEIVADRKISLEEIEKKVTDFFLGPLNKNLFEPLENTTQQSLNELFKLIPSTILDLVPLDEAFSGGHITFEFKNVNGAYDLTLYSTGPVLKYHEKTASGSPIWPLVIQGISPEKLDSDFFHKIHTFLLSPMKDQKKVLSLDDFMDSILQYFDQKPSSNLSTRNLETNPSSEQELLWLMLSEETDIEDLRYRLHKQLLLDFWHQKQAQNKGSFNFKEREDLETLSDLTDTLKKDVSAIQSKLDRTELQKILATLNELELLIEEEKKSLSKAAKIHEVPLIPKPLQKFIADMGFDAQKIADFKPTLIFLFGDEVGRLMDQIGISLEKNPLPTKPSPTITVKGVLRQIFSIAFIHTAITLLRIAFGAAGLTPSSIPVFLIIQGGHTLLKHLLPEPILSWYLSAIEALERLITECIWRVIYWSIKLVLPEAHFHQFKGGLTAFQDFVQQGARSILGENELKFTIQHAAREISPPTLENLLKTHPPVKTDTFEIIRNAPPLLDFSKGLADEGFHDARLLFYLNKLEKLPLPVHGQKGYWDTLQNPQEEIRKLYSIYDKIIFCRSALSGTTIKLRTSLALYTLLAAMDRLARRDKNNYLEGLQPNTLPLLSLANKDFALIDSLEQMNRLEALKNYFYPNSPEKGPLFESYVKNIRKTSLFEYSDHVCGSAETEYYGRILNTPQGRQWYAVFDQGESLSFPLKQPLPPTQETYLQFDQSAYKALFEESLYVEEKCDLLPEAFIYLKQITLSANSLLAAETLEKFTPRFHHQRIYQKDSRHFLLRLLDEKPLTWEYNYEETHGQNYALPETQNTQHDILCVERNSLYLDSEFYINKEKVEPLDVIPRLCEFLLKQKPLQLSFIEEIRDYFFTKNTKYLFDASPEYAEKVFSILEKLISSSILSKQWPIAFALLEIELSLQAFKNDFKRSQACRIELLNIALNEKLLKEKVFLTYVLSLPENPGELSDLERDQACQILIRGRFIKKIAQNILFLERFLQYGPLIHQKLENEISRKNLISHLFADLQIQLPSEKSEYKNGDLLQGDYQFSLNRGLIFNLKKGEKPLDDFLLKKAELFLIDHHSPKDLLQKEENLFVADQGNIELKWDPENESFSMTRLFDGVKYALIKGTIPDAFIWIHSKKKREALHLWQEVSSAKEKRLLVKTLFESDPCIFWLNESNELVKAITKEEELEWVDPLQAAASLKSLSRFFSFEKAACWKRPGEKHLRYIQLDEKRYIKIEKDAKAAYYFDGENFHILSKESTHPSMMGVPCYLLIEGAGGNKEVLIPEDNQWFSAFLGRSYHVLGLHPSLMRPLEEITKRMFLEKVSLQTFKYQITQEGHLNSFDPNALLHLLLTYLLQGEKKKATYTLDRFLAEAKLRRVDSNILNKLFPLTFMPPEFENISDDRQKIIAALQENWLMFPVKDTKLNSTKEFSWVDLLFVANTVIDLNKLQSIPEPFRKLTQKEEYFLFVFLFEKMEGIAKSLLHKKIQAVLNPEILFELFQISPTLTERFRALRHLFGYGDQWTQTTSKIISKATQGGSLLMKYTGYSLPEMKKTEHSIDTSCWKKMIREQIIQRKYSFKEPERIYYDLDRSKNENPPIKYEEMTPENIRKYFLTYYAICMGEWAPDLKKPLSKTLFLSKGKLTEDEAVLLNYLELTLISPQFCLPSSILQSALDKQDYIYFTNFFSLIHQTTTAKGVLKNIGYTVQDIGLKIVKEQFLPKTKDTVTNLKQAKELVLQTTSEPIRDFKVNYLLEALESPVFNVEMKCPVEHLDKANLAVDHLLEGIFNIAFEEHWFNRSSKKEKGIIVKALSQGQSQIERVTRVNQSSIDFKQRDTQELGFKFLGEDKLGELLIALKTQRNNLNAYLKERERNLLKILRPSYIPKPFRVTLSEMHEALVKGELGLIGQKLKLTQQELADLEAMFMHYVVLKGRLEQMNRACKWIDDLTLALAVKSKQAPLLLEKLASSLKEKRSYSFQTLPSELTYKFAFFEWMTGTILFPNQIKAIERLYSEGQKNVVQELLMAFGKTFFGIPTIDAISANGKQIIFNIFPSPLAPTFTQDNSQRNGQAYRLKVHAFTMDRFSQRGSKNYQAAHIALQSAKSDRAIFSSTKPDLQAFELNFLDLCYQDTTSKQETALESLKPSLREIRESGKVIGDEGHDLFNQREELNYPVGHKKKLEKTFILAIDRAIRLLLEEPLLARLIAENQLVDVDQEYYLNNIVPKIAKKLSESKELNLKDSDRLLFIDYLSGKTEQISEFLKKHPQFEEICLIRGVLLKLFKNALHQSVNIHFGRSLENSKIETIKPYHGNNNPLEQCTILSPYEELVKTYLTYLHEGLSLPQVESLVALMIESSRREVKLRKIDPENTQAYKILKKWAPSADFDFPLSQETMEKIKRNHEAALLYIRKKIAPQIAFWERALRSNPQNFASMFASLYFDSGTPYNDGVYHASLKMLWDPGTIGEALHLIQAKNPQDGIHLLTAEKPKDLMHEIIDTYLVQRKDISLIVDGGALLKGIPNDVMVDRMSKTLKMKRPDIKACVFMTKNKEGDLLVYRDIASGKNYPFSQCPLPKEEYVTYLDEIHGFGTNVPQAGSCVVLVDNQPLFCLLQNAFRLRSLKEFKKLFMAKNFSQIVEEGQKQLIYFAVTKKTAHKINQGSEKLHLEVLINYVTDLEAKQAALDNYQAYIHKLHDIIRRAIIDKMLFAPTLSATKEIFNAFKDFLVPKIDFSPSKLFGWIEKEKNTSQVLDLLIQQMEKIYSTTSYFSKEEKASIKQRMIDLPRPPMPDQVTVFTDGKEIDFQLDDTLGKEATIEQNSEQENELNQEKESSTQHKFQKVYQESLWPSFNPRSLEFLTLTSSSHPLFEIAEKGWSFLKMKNQSVMPTFYYVHDHLNKSTIESLRELAPHVDKRIWFSEHYLPRESFGDPLSEFGSKTQCDLFEIVVHYTKKSDSSLEILKVGVLTQKEATHWKKMLQKHKDSKNMGVIVYDTYTREAVAGDTFDSATLKAMSEFKLLEGQLRYLSAALEYPKDIRKPMRSWLSQFNPNLLLASFAALSREKNQVKSGLSDIELMIAKTMNLPIEEAI